MNHISHRYGQLALWILVYVGAGWLIGAATSDAVNSWYKGLEKAAINPPPLAFPIVWCLLYVMIAVSGWRLWPLRGLPGGRLVMSLFVLQTLMNWAWSFIFFEAHLLGLAYGWILALVAVVAALILRAWRADRSAALLLIPYLLWLAFASYLSGSVWVLN